MRINTCAEEVDVQSKIVRLSDGSTLSYDFLVIATGAVSSLPKIPGAEKNGVFSLKSLSDAIRIKAHLKERRCRKVVIVGAGFIAMEMAEALRTAGMDTLIIHRGSLPASRWDKEFGAFMLEELKRHSVSFLADREVSAIEDGDGYSLRIITSREEIAADMVLFALGVRPNIKLASDMGVAIGVSGAIKVNYAQATNIEGVYAVGDCCETFHQVSKRWVNMPLGDVANKQGRSLGQTLGGGTALFPGVVGAQSFKLFTLEVAATGIDEKEAALSGYSPVSTIVWGTAMVPSLPGAKKVGMKMVADRSTGKLLGAQALGEMGAVSRINVLSCALWGNMTLNDIAQLDLAYTPPFGTAWDIMHIAAQNLKKQIR